MKALVDFGNIPPSVVHNGPRALAIKIADRLVQSSDAAPQRLHLRLYGGWYEDSSPTPLAENLARTLDSAFPFPYRPVRHRTTTGPAESASSLMLINAELAYATLAEPNHHLLNTYRKKGCPAGLRGTDPIEAGCTDPSCGLRYLPKLLKKGSCPADACAVRAHSLISRGEQKLVDVMLASDLLFLVTTRPSDAITLVSSDHDLWPAIRQAIVLSGQIVHIQPKLGQQAPAYYIPRDNPNYTQIELEASQ